MDEKYDLWYYDREHCEWYILEKNKSKEYILDCLSFFFYDSKKLNMKSRVYKIAYAGNKKWMKNIPINLLKK